MTKDKTRHLRSLQKTLHYFLQLNSKNFVAEKDLFRQEKALKDLMAIEHSQDIRVKGPTNPALLTQGYLTDGHVVSLVLENVFRQTLEIAKSNSKIKLMYKIVQDTKSDSAGIDSHSILMFMIKFTASKSSPLW